MDDRRDGFPTMNAKNLGILAVVTAAVAGLASWAVYRERATVTPKAETGLLLPGLGGKVNEVAVIEIRSGEKSLTVHRDPAKADAAWTVKELGEYPAKFEKVKGLIVGLSALEKVEPKTDRADSYEKIGVEDPAAGNAATLVKVSGGSGPAASLIVGKAKPAGDRPQVYVRIPDQKQSWLARGELGLTADAVEWVDREIIKLDSLRVKSASVVQADGERLSVSRPTKEATYTVEGVPEGRALKTQNAASPVAGGLAFLNFDGVKPAGDVAWDTGAEATAEYRTFDGLVVTVTSVEAGEAVWAKFAASFDESAVAPAVPAAPGDGHEPTDEEKAAAQKAADEARQRSIDQVKKEVEALNAKLGPWAYQVPKTKGEQFRRRIGDLLAEPPKADQAPAPSDEEDGGQTEPPGQADDGGGDDDGGDPGDGGPGGG